MQALGQTVPSAQTLKSRVFRATAWLIAGNFASQALRLGSNLVLTRLLMPEAFGLAVAVSTLYYGLAMFSDLGIWAVVVRSQRGADARFLGTALLIQMLRGALLALLVLLLAAAVWLAAGQGWFAANTVYADPRLPALIAVCAVCALIEGMQSMQLALAQRELAGRQMVSLEMLTQLATFAITAYAAWLTGSVWALLLGTVAGVSIKTALSYRLLPGQRIRPCWDADSAREIIGYGKWLFVSSVTYFLAAQGEKLILGATLGLVTFGVFSIASNLMAAVIGLYATINGRVIYPGMSKVLLDADQEAMRRAYCRAQQLVDLVLGAASGVLLMAGHRVVALLYDARYADAGWMLQILALGLLALRHQVVEQVMFAQGRPGWASANNVLRALGLAVFIPAGYMLGGERGAILGVMISQFASWPLYYRYKYANGLLNRASEQLWLPALLLGATAGWLLDAAAAAWLR